MASMDLSRFLGGWDYEPNQITVRKIVGEDGTIRIQMRVDLGILQMEASGRPDGQRPHGFESLLAYHRHRLAGHLEKNGTELGFELTVPECAALRDEAAQYYHRYLAEFVLEDFEGVERDTTRNLQLLDLCRRHAPDQRERRTFEQHRPYLVMMNARSKAQLALRRGALKTALAHVEAGLQAIGDFFAEAGQEEAFARSVEVGILQSLAREIAARLPQDPMQKLEGELRRALDEERYEEAAVLRDRIFAMRHQTGDLSAGKPQE